MFDVKNMDIVVSDKPEHMDLAHERRQNILRIIYNRVPKCGSTTVHTILQKLSSMNKYTFIRSNRTKAVTVLPLDEERALIEDLQAENTPWLFVRHMQMINFSQWNLDMPEYINVIRDPSDRKRSGFYYGGKLKEKMSFDECVEKTIPGCIQSNMLMFFCGMHQNCSSNKLFHTLSIAKQNVQKYYGVVGIMEDMESYFQLLEARYPQLFSGATTVYRNATARNVNTKFSHSMKETTRLRLHEFLKCEYDFYRFIKQRLYEAKQAAGLLP